MKNSNWTHNSDKIILFDNGAYEIKHSTALSKRSIKITQNCKFFEKMYNSETSYFIDDIKKDFPVENLSNINKNYSRPLSRGLLSDIDLQCEVWSHILNEQYKDISPKESLFMFTHTPCAPDEVIEGYFQILFEYFGFDSLFKAIPHVFTALYAKEKYPDNIHPSVQLIVDSGFSSTTIVPILGGRPLYNSIKRIDIGGKLLSNYLKENLVNSIDLDIRKEFFLVNLIKEECCYVSKNFNLDMKISSLKDNDNINKKIFILPEYRKKNEDLLKKIPTEKYSIMMNNLRFIIPELIFNPNLIGLDQGGLHEGIIQIIKECNKDYSNLFYSNIVISGGNSKFTNFKERLKNELIPLTDLNTTNSEEDIKIFDSSIIHGNESEPVISGMKIFARNIENLKDVCISKQEYDEMGFNVVWKNCY